MASSNDRKISQLPFANSVNDDTTFVVVGDISTIPKNQRTNTQVLFHQIPVPVTVGKELDGKDVIFNTTLSATNKFHFDASDGDLSLGRDLTVANTVTIANDLIVSGTAYLGLINPTFDNMELTGYLKVGTYATVEGLLTANANSVFNKNATVVDNLTVGGTVAVTGNINTDGSLTSNTVTSNTINSTDLVVSDSITGVQNITSAAAVIQDITAGNSVVANGFIRSLGNVYGTVANFTSLDVVNNAQVNQTLTSLNLSVVNNATVSNLLTSTNISSTDLTSANATIASLNSTLLTSVDVESDNVNAIAITAQTISTDSFIIDTINANNVIVDALTGNTVNTEHVFVSKTVFFATAS